MTFLYIIIAFIFFFYFDEIKYIINNIILENKKYRLATIKAERIALIKILSNDSADIEKFITDNANILSETSIKKLISRIELLKADQLINNTIKSRFDIFEPEAEIEESAEVDKRKKRR